MKELKSKFSNPAFNSVASGFNLVPAINSFSSIFGPIQLDEKDSQTIEQLLNECPVSESQTEKDIVEMKRLTAEIKSIGRQGLVLIGERVYKAREILKPYGDGSFTQWLIDTFQSRRTGYNYLAYYEFYQELPNQELKEGFKRLPQKSAYKLASRKGNFELKYKIVRDCHHLPIDEIDAIIENMLPVDIGDQRRRKQPQLIDDVLQSLYQIQNMRLSKEELGKLAQCQELIEAIIADMKFS
jgi:hypothetical protein